MKFIVNVNGKIFYKPSQFKKYLIKIDKVGHYFKGSYKYYETEFSVLIYNGKKYVYIDRFDIYL